jgi:hypothetical protein
MNGSSVRMNEINTDKKNNYSNLVAISDYQAALRGIENVPIPGDEHWDDAEKKLFQQTKESLAKNLTRCVRPIADEEYYLIMNRNLISQDDDSTDDSSATDNDDDDNDDMDKDVANHYEKDGFCPNTGQSSEEYDEVDYIDYDAVARVTQLRAEVRYVSHKLAQYRDRVTQKAMSLGDPRIRLEEELQYPEAAPLQTQQVQESLRRAPTDEDASHAIRERFVNIIQQVTDHLKEYDLEPPTKALQETLNTVEVSQMEPLSQIERTIRSRDGNDKEHKFVLWDTSSCDDPMERLNQLFG